MYNLCVIGPQNSICVGVLTFQQIIYLKVFFSVFNEIKSVSPQSFCIHFRFI